MKKTSIFLILLSLTWFFQACNAVDFDFNDPQDIKTIQDAIQLENADLWELFGEENIHFGPVPPSIGDSICFMVNGLYYDTCIRYIFDLYNNNEPILSHADPPVYDASTNVHLFHNQYQCIFQHELRTRDSYNSTYALHLDTAYIIGHDNVFTTYYVGKIGGNGDPTVAMIISGTLVYDTITSGGTQTLVFKGVKDYLFGKKILKYEYQPTNAYAPGTIEIKKHPGLSPSCEWDDNQ